MDYLETNNTFDSINDFDGTISGTILNNPQPLFVRIDKEKMLQDLQ